MKHETLDALAEFIQQTTDTIICVRNAEEDDVVDVKPLIEANRRLQNAIRLEEVPQ